MSEIKAIIPARSGSKGIKNKNISPFAGKSLLEYAVDFCLDSGVDEIIVSSDSEAYLEMVDTANYQVAEGIHIKAHLRSSVTSNDSATDFEVLLELYEDKLVLPGDVVAWVRPTSPMRCTDEFRKASEFFISVCKRRGSLRSIKPSKTHPYWMKKFDSSNASIEPFVSGCDERLYPNRQVLTPCFEITSEYDFLAVDDAMRQQVFLPLPMCGFVTNTSPKIDIDTPMDFKIAELAFMAFRGEKL